MSESEIGRKLAALEGRKKKSVRGVVKDDLAGILAARDREVDWSKIVAEIASEVGHPVNERTVRTYVSDLRNPIGPAKLQGEPRARSEPAPGATAPVSTNPPAARIQKDPGTRAAPDSRRDIEKPGAKKPVTPPRLT
jgi:hypothetical protein